VDIKMKAEGKGTIISLKVEVREVAISSQKAVDRGVIMTQRVEDREVVEVAEATEVEEIEAAVGAEVDEAIETITKKKVMTLIRHTLPSTPLKAKTLKTPMMEARNLNMQRNETMTVKMTIKRKALEEVRVREANQGVVIVGQVQEANIIKRI
jgi:hypothetical protein